jgi:hypothetical protein
VTCYVDLLVREIGLTLTPTLWLGRYPDPIATASPELTPRDFGIALVGFVLLIVWHAPPLVVVIISALGGSPLPQATS